MRSFIFVWKVRTIGCAALLSILQRFCRHVRWNSSSASSRNLESSSSVCTGAAKRNYESSILNRIKWKQLLEDDAVVENIKRRQETASVGKLRQLWEQLNRQDEGNASSSAENRLIIQKALLDEALRFPNDTHNAAIACGTTPQAIRIIGQPPKMDKPKDIQELCESRGYLKSSNLGDLAGTRQYVLKGFLAELEQALIHYTMEVLKNEGFQLISVPDFLYAEVIESCGFPVKSDRTMVYEIETEDGQTPVYLSGTSEMGIAGYLSNRTFESSELPLKLAAVSRCFRAEVSSMEEERGIYRVHNFSKVEMFCVTGSEGKESDELHEYICSLQEKLFAELGLHFRVMEMSPNELGSPAYRKFDIEAWMPGRQQFGEISSCSNCTDFQSRRLNIRYKDNFDKAPKFVHTLNGTACAIPRMLIALIESCQTDDGNMILPSVLQKYMHSEWDKRPSKSQSLTFLKSRGHQDKVLLHYDPWRE